MGGQQRAKRLGRRLPFAMLCQRQAESVARLT